MDRSAAHTAHSATPSAAIGELSITLGLDVHDFVTFQTVWFVLSAINKSTEDGTKDLDIKFGSTDSERRQIRQQSAKSKQHFKEIGYLLPMPRRSL